VAAVVATSCATDAPDRPTENPDAVAAASPPAAVDPGSGPMLDLETALSLAAMPLSCVDRPHALRPDRAGYLDDISYTRRRDFDRSRAFYGCWDWHSAVNSTWAMVRLVKEVPGLPVAPLIREKLRDHLSEEALAGELEYLSDNPSFERPYGWVWLLLLHGELASWDDPFGAVWAERLEPVVSHLSDRLIDYLEDLERPVRTGVHPNTAFALATALQAEEMAERPELAEALRTAAELRVELAEHVAAPLQWWRGVGTLVALGVTHIVEFGHKGLLTSMLRRAGQDVSLLNVYDADSADAAAKELRNV